MNTMTQLAIPTGAGATPPVQPKTPAGLQFGSGVMGGTHGVPCAEKRSPAKAGKNQIKILLVDDHPVVRKGLASCLAQQSNLDVVGEAANGQEAFLHFGGHFKIGCHVREFPINVTKIYTRAFACKSTMVTFL